jgi:hypothetical protein
MRCTGRAAHTHDLRECGAASRGSVRASASVAFGTAGAESAFAVPQEPNMNTKTLIVLCCLAPATVLAEDQARTRAQDRTPSAATTPSRDQARQRDQIHTPDRDQTGSQATAKGQQEKTIDEPQTLTADQTRQRDRVRDQIHKEAKLTSAEQQALAQPLDHYIAMGGNPERLRAMARTSVEAGCKGVCLSEMVRSLNRSRHQGVDEDRSFEMVGTALREMKQERDRLHEQATDAQVRDRLRQRIDADLGRGGGRGQHMRQSSERGMGPGMQRHNERMQDRPGQGQGPSGQGAGQGHHGPGRGR